MKDGSRYAHAEHCVDPLDDSHTRCPLIVAPAASAEIVTGKTTNRVKVKRRARTTGTAMVRFKKDPSTRGLDYVQLSISVPVGELAQIDAWAERAQMARSHFLRQAAKHFAAKVFS